jgi:hypothetical protein
MIEYAENTKVIGERRTPTLQLTVDDGLEIRCFKIQIEGRIGDEVFEVISSYLNQQGYRTENPTGKEEYSYSIVHHYDPDEDKTRFKP